MLSFSTASLGVLALASTSALAHMQMAWPPSLLGKYNPLVPNEQKDWNPQNPLEPDGSNFPCGGHIGKDKNIVATFEAGKTMNFSLIGTTPGTIVHHNGGSCQVALSYDSGKTWSTIWSYMGGCVMDKQKYDVMIPPEAPSGEVLFAWDWFNLQGNREMYQNCALVTIKGGGKGLTDKKAFPPPFVANVGNGCATQEGANVVFPSPGKNVFYGGAYASTKPTAPTGFTGSNCVPAGQQDAGSYNGPAPGNPTPGGDTNTTNPAPVPGNPANPTQVNSPANPPAKGGPNNQNLQAPPSATPVPDAPPVTTPVPAGPSDTPAPVKVCRRRKRNIVKKSVDERNRNISERAPDAGSIAHHRAGMERRHERLVRKHRVAALPAGRP